MKNYFHRKTTFLSKFFAHIAYFLVFALLKSSSDYPKLQPITDNMSTRISICHINCVFRIFYTLCCHKCRQSLRRCRMWFSMNFCLVQCFAPIGSHVKFNIGPMRNKNVRFWPAGLRFWQKQSSDTSLAPHYRYTRVHIFIFDFRKKWFLCLALLYIQSHNNT